MTSAAEAASREPSALRIGLIAGVCAYLMWGLFPAFFRLLDHVPPAEIVAHRILWSVPVGALLLTLRKQWSEVRAAFANLKVLGALALSALCITGNWLIYIWAVANDRVIEASLGYYINPLVFIAAGVFVLRETLSRLQIFAVALATAGVLTLTFGAGTFPWVAATLAISFSAYGYIRKMTPVGALPGLFIETMLLSPAAFLFLVFLQGRGALAFGSISTETDLLLAFSGPLTVGPLVLFAIAARRLPLATVGFLQYISPTGQFLLGLLFGEPFTTTHAAAFGLIWTALAISSVEAVRKNRAERLARAAAGALPVSRSPSASPKS